MSPEAQLGPRPLSPRLASYRRTMTMMMSTVHRLTGTALYFVTLLLIWWLIAAAAGQTSCQLFESWIGSAAGKFVLLCYTWTPIHHLPGGSRHFAWDIGQEFDLPTANLMARATLIGSVILTGPGLDYRDIDEGRTLMKDMRTPLSRVRRLGPAKAGIRDFWIPRLTAAANVPLALFLIASLVALTGADYATVRNSLGNPLVAIPMLLLVLSGPWHIGMQVIPEDCIPLGEAQSGLVGVEQFPFSSPRNRRRRRHFEDPYSILARQGTT